MQNRNEDPGKHIYLEDGTAIKAECEEGETVNGERKCTFKYHEGIISWHPRSRQSNQVSDDTVLDFRCKLAK